jgi:hypothetical protein
LDLVEHALRELGLAADVQQPRIEHGAGRNVAVRTGGVSREGQRAPIGARLHVGAHEAHLAVRGMEHAGSLLERPHGGVDVPARETGLAPCSSSSCSTIAARAASLP